MVSGLVFSSNIIDNSKGTSYAVVIFGDQNNPVKVVKNVQVSNNIISNSASAGIRIVYVEDGVVMGNSGNGNVSVLIEPRFTKNIIYDGNTCLDQPVLRFGGAYTNPDNVFFGNRGDIQSATSVANSSLILGNYNSLPFQTSIAAVPRAVEAVTVSGGNAYVSIGTSSSADWKQIS